LYVGHTVGKNTGAPLTLTIVEQFVDAANTCQGKVRQKTISFAPSPYLSRDARNYYVVELKPHGTNASNPQYEVGESQSTTKSR